MNNHRFVRWLRPLTLLVVLALAFSLTSPVRAEGEVPAAPPDAAAGESSPPADSGGVPAADPAADPGGEAPLPGKPEAGLPAAESAPPDLSQVVDTLNENNLMLENSAGEAVPLASEEAAALLAEPDPWFISGTVKYRFVGGACPPPDPAPALTEVCTGSLGNPIQAAVNYIQTTGRVPNNGTIYVDSGTFSGPVTINGSLANLNAIKALVGKGPNATTISNSVSVLNLSGGFRLEGFLISATLGTPLVTFNNIGGKLVLKDLVVKNNGAGGGIRVENSKASLEAQNVKSSGNGGVGLYVDNTAGSGNVSILSADFSNNNNTGLQVFTNGAVLLNGVSTRFNLGDGALLVSQKGVTVRNGVFGGNAVAGALGNGLVLGDLNRGNVVLDWVYANSNDEYGLVLYTRAGSITLSNIDANFNNRDNLLIDNCYDAAGVCTSPAAPVSLTNVSATYSANGNGIDLVASGAVTLTNVNASFNKFASFVDNSYAVAAAPVTIIKSTFSYTVSGAGLEVYSKGRVVLNSVTASNNSLRGVYIYNEYPTGSVTLLAGQGNNTFWGNGNTGLEITALGPVSLAMVDSSFNGSSSTHAGALITTNGNVTVSGSESQRARFDSNFGKGLDIVTRGTVSLNFLQASGNGQTNLSVNNTSGSGNVAMNSVFTSTSTNGSGISILSTGSVALRNVSAVGNKMLGAIINNASPRKLGVSITGGRFDSNKDIGLQINTSGPVALNNVSASDNSAADSSILFGSKLRDVLFGGTDIWRFNLAATTTTTVKVSHLAGGQVTVRIYNPSNALVSTLGPSGTVTFGPTSLTMLGTWRVEVSGTNGAYFIFLGAGASPSEPGGSGTPQVFAPGLLIDNTFNASTAPVSIINSDPAVYRFWGNALHGVYITTKGNLTLTNVSAGQNGGSGITAFNLTNPRTYTLRNITSFNNFGSGLELGSGGSILLTGFDISNNTNYGIYFNTASLVTIQGLSKGSPGVASGNTTVGIWVSTNKSVTMRFVNVNGSGNNQVMFTVLNGGSVQVSDVNINNGGSSGMVLNTFGPVRIVNATIQNSVFNNLSIDNSFAVSGNPGVILDNVSVEGGGGILISTKGPVTVSRITAQNLTYGSGGLRIQQLTGSVGAVSVRDSKFLNAASQSGAFILAKGNVSLINVTASGNGQSGVEIDAAVLPVRTVTVTNSQFNGNGQEGLYVFTNGNILVTNSSAFSNSGGSGMLLANDGPDGAGTITVTATGSNFTEASSNSSYGLNLLSKRSIIVSRVRVMENGVGLRLVNDDPAAVGNITLTNILAYYNNSGGTVSSRGAVFGDRLDFTDNFGPGLQISIPDNSEKGTVIQRSTFFSNSGLGLSLVVDGPVTLNTINASENTQHGVFVDNRTSSTAPVIVAAAFGPNFFNENGWSGLRALSRSPISVTNATANKNGYNGISLNNYYIGAGTGNIILNNVTASQNVGFEGGIAAGISAETNGQVIGNNLRAMLNGVGTAGYGIYIKTTNNNATLSNSVFSANRNSGIYAYLQTSGLLTLNNVFYYGNDTGGGGVDPEVRVIN